MLCEGCVLVDIVGPEKDIYVVFHEQIRKVVYMKIRLVSSFFGPRSTSNEFVAFHAQNMCSIPREQQ